MLWPFTWLWGGGSIPLCILGVNGQNRQGLTELKRLILEPAGPQLHKSLYPMGDRHREQKAKEWEASDSASSGKWVETCKVKRGWRETREGWVLRREAVCEGKTRTSRDRKLKSQLLHLQKENVHQSQDPGNHSIWRYLVETLGRYLRTHME